MMQLNYFCKKDLFMSHQDLLSGFMLFFAGFIPHLVKADASNVILLFEQSDSFYKEIHSFKLYLKSQKHSYLHKIFLIVLILLSYATCILSIIS